MGRDDIDRRGLLAVRDHCSHGVGVLAFQMLLSLSFIECCVSGNISLAQQDTSFLPAVSRSREQLVSHLHVYNF